MIQQIQERIGVVVIGRNEGQRLVSCIDSLLGSCKQIVYVDSGSKDNSVEMVQNKGLEAICLDMSMAFTAARARNAGLHRLLQLFNHVQFVQFIDGDCEVDRAWITKAIDFLDTHPGVAVVCGRRRERYPERSIYNFICDQEWDSPVGEAKACGGDALMRIQPLVQLGGYNPDLIAGEEPELCVRLRAVGWKIWRIDAEMTLHDAAMTKFSQWWKRNTRSGYAFAEGVNLHGSKPEQHWVVESRRALIWGGLIPGLALIFLPIQSLISIALLMLYPIQMIRIWRNNKDKYLNKASWIAFYLVIGKFPEFVGQLKFIKALCTRRGSHLIEYK